MDYNNESHITNKAEVKEFFHYIVYDYNLEEFHPDDAFEDYKNEKTHERVFTEEESGLYNRLLGECFIVCEEADMDIYDLGWSVLEKFLMGED